MKKEEELKYLFRKSELSKKCRNLDIAQNKTFVSDLGNGNPYSPLFFVGEAPGKNEDEMGIPFQGLAGKFLNESLESIGLNREDIWIGNLLKYRPTQKNEEKNRKPKKSEINACLPLLKKEIEIVNPKIIITLGVLALNALKRKKYKLKNISGQVLKYNNRILFPTYHPAAAYRFPKIEKKFKNDLNKLKELIQKK